MSYYPPHMLKQIGEHNAAAFSGPVDQDCKTCSTAVDLYARYEDQWQTPFTNAPFDLYVNGAKVCSNRLKSAKDIGAQPGEKLSSEQWEKLGTFNKANIPHGTATFELTSSGSEDAIQQIEKDIAKLTEQTITAQHKKYQKEWGEWNSQSALGKGAELISKSFEGFVEGSDAWLESEKGLWASIGNVFSDIWDSIKSFLGDIPNYLKIDDLLKTADALWQGMKEKVASVASAVAKMPDKIKQIYMGTLAVIDNIGEIGAFIYAFGKRDINGIERFIDHTLPKLAKGTQLKSIASDLRHSFDSWSFVIELVGFTNAPALLTSAVMGICMAIPPTIWALNSVLSLTIVLIELIVSAILAVIGLLVALVSAGTAAAVSAAMLVGRVAKMATLGGKVYQFFQDILDKIQPIIDKCYQLAETSLKARQKNTRTSAIATGAARTQIKQERKTGEPKKEGCEICGKELGKNGHPKKSPDREGIVEREGAGRITGFGPTGRYSDGAVKKNMINAQSDEHPVKKGVTMTHHHILMISQVEKAVCSKTLKSLGYVIHDKGNLVLMPNHEFGACHLMTQLHKSRHPIAGTLYEKSHKAALSSVQKEMKKGNWCDDSSSKKVQEFMNKRSDKIVSKINDFDIAIQNGNFKYHFSQSGCGHEECNGLRSHGPGAPQILRQNKPIQAKENTPTKIDYTKPTSPWILETAR